MTKKIFAAAISLIALNAQAALPKDVVCTGTIEPRTGHTIYGTLAPMPQDASMSIWKQDQFSFVTDFYDYAKDGSIRLFIHDTKADYTAVSDGVMKRVGGNHELQLQQIIGYDSDNPITLTLDCVK